jgi:pyridoxal phosphate enzyme (YggS family)
MLAAGDIIAQNLRQLEEEISTAALRVGRKPEEITLIGVSKTQPVDAIAEAVRAGVRHIGENRVQEAAAKFPALGVLLDHQQLPTRHLVGHLQSNKAANAVELFERIDSVDSLRLAEALARRLHDGRPLSVLLEVYVGDDPARPGLRAEGLVDAVGPILEVRGLRVEGLMTVAPLGGDARAAFRQVATMKQRLVTAFPRVHFGVLSMGMSEDFSVAIEEGATEIRVGTALFGPRKLRP